jgi:hypothetical protein
MKQGCWLPSREFWWQPFLHRKSEPNCYSNSSFWHDFLPRKIRLGLLCCWIYFYYSLSQDSPLITVAGYSVGDRGSIPGRTANSLVATASRPSLGLAQPLLGIGEFFHGIKWPEHEFDRPLLSSSEAKNASKLTSTALNFVIAQRLSKHRGNITLHDPNVDLLLLL